LDSYFPRTAFCSTPPFSATAKWAIWTVVVEQLHGPRSFSPVTLRRQA
jgi:hypothetical protein